MNGAALCPRPGRAGSPPGPDRLTSPLARSCVHVVTRAGAHPWWVSRGGWSQRCRRPRYPRHARTHGERRMSARHRKPRRGGCRWWTVALPRNLLPAGVIACTTSSATLVYVDSYYLIMLCNVFIKKLLYEIVLIIVFVRRIYNHNRSRTAVSTPLRGGGGGTDKHARCG